MHATHMRGPVYYCHLQTMAGQRHVYGFNSSRWDRRRDQTAADRIGGSCCRGRGRGGCSPLLACIGSSVPLDHAWRGSGATHAC